MQAPRKIHLRAAHRVFQYLYTTRTHRLVYRSGSPLQAVIYSDASHGSAVDIPYATRGYIVQMAGGTVTWFSKKIKMVTLSSTEAEYVAACKAVKEAIQRGLVDLEYISTEEQMADITTKVFAKRYV